MNPGVPLPRTNQRATRAVIACLALVASGPFGCAREDTRGDVEVCSGIEDPPGKECPTAEVYLAKSLSPPPCTQDPGDCRAENVRGPTIKSGFNDAVLCCYTYTHIQKADPIW